MTGTRTSPWKTWGVWLLSVFLAFVFAMMGGAKLMGSEMMVASFERWGYPMWFLYAVGGMEVMGAILLLVPSLTTYGALLLGVIMVGAIPTHLASGEAPLALVPLTLLALLCLVAYARWSRVKVLFLRQQDIRT